MYDGGLIFGCSGIYAGLEFLGVFRIERLLNLRPLSRVSLPVGIGVSQRRIAFGSTIKQVNKFRIADDFGRNISTHPLEDGFNLSLEFQCSKFAS